MKLEALDDKIGFALRMAQVAVFKHLIAALQPFDLRPVDLSVLQLIGDNPGVNQKSLADALSIKRPNLVSIINQLQRRNLVKRKAIPGNLRTNALSLTAAGRKLLTRAKAVDAKHLKAIHAAIGKEQAPALLSALKRIAALGDR